MHTAARTTRLTREIIRDAARLVVDAAHRADVDIRPAIQTAAEELSARHSRSRERFERALLSMLDE